MKSYKDKFKEVGEITVQNILDWLDGCAVLCKVTTTNIDWIGTYGKEQYHYVVFSKETYPKIYLSNKRWLDNAKSILDEYSAGRDAYWKSISRNAIKKCKNRDSAIRIILRILLPYFHFRIYNRNYEYINIKKIISKDGRSVYVHDKSKEISLLQSKVWETEKQLKKAKINLRKLEEYQKIHEELHYEK